MLKKENDHQKDVHKDHKMEEFVLQEDKNAFEKVAGVNYKKMKKLSEALKLSE